MLNYKYLQNCHYRQFSFDYIVECCHLKALYILYTDITHILFLSADFAVGAPFHETGKVYIWMGSKKGISQEPSQVTSVYIPPKNNLKGPYLLCSHPHCLPSIGD